MQHVVAFRFSALGDIAMTLPVLKEVLLQNPILHITLITPAFHAPLYDGIERLSILPIDIKGEHKNVIGLYKLYKKIKKLGHLYGIADMHNVLRTIILRSFFKPSRVRIAVVDKGRKEKKWLTQKKNKQLRPLKHMCERYADVFRQLGYSVTLTPKVLKSHVEVPMQSVFAFDPNKKNICIAPFAKHKEKMYPLHKMEHIVEQLYRLQHVQLFFLGGGVKEIQLLEKWEKKYGGTVNLAGRFSFKEELSILQMMDVVVSMDSANMHLASLYGVPVISIWGATHPYAGFYGWGQDSENAEQINLYCRPCSVFGNKPCYRGDHACMEQLPEEVILKKIKSIISQ